MKIVFLSAMCVLDTRSGAARAMRTLLEWLAAAGWEAHSITASLFDGNTEYPFETLVGTQVAVSENHGKLVELERNGVLHHIQYFASSLGRQATTDEKRALVQRAERLLERIRPDLVISYGSNHATSQALWSSARQHARRLVFYLANGQFEDPATFRAFDQVLCPSRFLCDHYRQRLGIDAGLLPILINEDSFAPPHEVIPASNIAARRVGFITFINPMLEKGAMLFLRLAQLAAVERPELTFLCVEGRIGASAWKRSGVDLAGMPNVWWLPNQQDIRPIYRRTSALLFPSFGPEAAGRSITEAQLGGIPVLGTHRGGIPGQLNGGGFLFEVPEGCRENHRKLPEAEAVRPWLDTLSRLMDDDAFYLDAVRRARRAAEPFEPERRRRELIAQLEELAQR